MKTIQVSTAQGTALDWLVAKCEGFGPGQYMRNIDIRFNVAGKVSCLLVPIDRAYTHWSPTTNWAQGGPIIEREIAKLERFSDALWEATAFTSNAQHFTQDGPTPLIAAMRCYVASKLGDTAEVPEELL
jgi:hypothetical protein